MRKGPPDLPTIATKPLGQTTLPERKFKLKQVETDVVPAEEESEEKTPPGQEKRADDETPPGQEKKQEAPQSRSLQGEIQLIPAADVNISGPQAPERTSVGAAVGECPSPTIDLKVLVIAAAPTDTSTTLPAIQQALGYVGTPYTVFTATPKPVDPNANRLAPLLSSGCHAFYQGVILGNGDVAYAEGSTWVGTALTAPEWQTAKRAQAITAQLKLDLPYNGEGTVVGMYVPDDLTPFVEANEGEFKWISHTYTHPYLDDMDYTTSRAELTQNHTTRGDLGLSAYNRANIITPNITGLENPEFMRAAWDHGVRYLVTDTSKPGYGPPSPNAGIYNPLQPGILMIPRYPTNLFYNVTAPAAGPAPSSWQD